MKFQVSDEEVKKLYENTAILNGGVYLGKIKQAYLEKTPNGALIIKFDFKGSDGYVSFNVTVQNIDGSENFNAGHIISLCTVLGLKEAEPIKSEVEYYDFTLGERTKKEVERYVCFENKPLYIVIEKNYYTKQDGSEGFSFELISFLNTEKRRADEIVNGLPAKYVNTVKIEDWYRPRGGKRITYDDYKERMQKQNSSYRGFNEPQVVENKELVEDIYGSDDGEEILPF